MANLLTCLYLESNIYSLFCHRFLATIVLCTSCTLRNPQLLRRDPLADLLFSSNVKKSWKKNIICH